MILCGCTDDGSARSSHNTACSLRALTADALALTKRGYRITRVEAFDLFPHTRFVEVLTVFEAS